MTGKRAPNIKKEARNFIHEVAISCPSTGRTELAEFLKEEVPKQGWRAPSIGTLEKMISAIRNNTEPVDEPWCIGVSSNYGIPIEATSDLLKILRKCLMFGRPFTIREAKWVARLRGIRDVDTILGLAEGYALRERVWEMENGNNPSAKTNLDTSDIDASLSFRHEGQDSKKSRETSWSLRTGIRCGFVPDLNPFADSIALSNKFEIDHSVALMSIYRPGMMQYQIVAANKENPEVMVPVELSNEMDEVFATWLRKFDRDGYGWSNLKRDQRIEIADRLANEIIEASKEMERLESCKKEALQHIWESADKEYEYFTACGDLHHFINNWEPSKELLHKVGLEPSIPEKKIVRGQWVWKPNPESKYNMTYKYGCEE